MSGLPFRDYTGQITVAPNGDGSVISTAISFRTIIPGAQILVAIAIRVASAPRRGPRSNRRPMGID